jgi:hypothetical protein
MRVSFERGDPASPRGHALVFFREVLDRSTIRACYVVVAPIEMDFAKYVPPMFAAQFGGMVASGPTALPLPPIPEQVESLAWLEQVAAAREDDLLDGGSLDPTNPQSMMLAAADVAAEYARLWTDFAGRLPDKPTRESQSEAQQALPDVDSILLSVMVDAEKVSRLAKLAGTLRYASEGGDEQLGAETLSQMERVGGYLDERYRVAELIVAAKRPDQTGARLLDLFIQRCYRLAAEEQSEVVELDRQIEALEPPSPRAG